MSCCCVVYTSRSSLGLPGSINNCCSSNLEETSPEVGAGALSINSKSLLHVCGTLPQYRCSLQVLYTFALTVDWLLHLLRCTRSFFLSRRTTVLLVMQLPLCKYGIIRRVCIYICRICTFVRIVHIYDKRVFASCYRKLLTGLLTRKDLQREQQQHQAVELDLTFQV